MYHHWRGILWIAHIKWPRNVTLAFQFFNVTQCNSTTSKPGSLILSASSDPELDPIVNLSWTPSRDPTPDSMFQFERNQISVFGSAGITTYKQGELLLIKIEDIHSFIND